mmetsp:Transcript_3941/g.10293  ORF Transcript_3941/g.10293 Transcript_3941/m.10293 type:complete len:247 (-) Transcript_3941:378-1118(-)
MNHTRGLRRCTSSRYRPGARLPLPRSVIRHQPQHVVHSPHQRSKSCRRALHPERQKKFFALCAIQRTQLAFNPRRHPHRHTAPCCRMLLNRTRHLISLRQIFISHIRRVHHRLHRQQIKASCDFQLTLAQDAQPRGPARVEDFCEFFQHDTLLSSLLPRGTLSKPTFDDRKICKSQLDVYHLDVRDRVHRAAHVHHSLILEAADDVDYCIAFTDICEELIPEAFTVARARHEPCDVDKVECRWYGS